MDWYCMMNAYGFVDEDLGKETYTQLAFLCPCFLALQWKYTQD